MAASPQDQDLSFAALLALMPDAAQRKDTDLDVAHDTNSIYDQVVRDLLQAANREGRAKGGSKVLSGLKVVNPTAVSLIAIYYAKVEAGDLTVGHVYKRYAARDDIVLIGAGNWGNSYKLDGAPAVVLTADGKTYWCVLVEILVNGVLETHAVFGAEAADAAEVRPTPALIKTAIVGAAIANVDLSAGILEVGWVKYQRVATDTIAETWVDPASDNDLAAARAVATSWGLVTE